MSVSAAAARDINHIHLLTSKDMSLSKLKLPFSWRFTDKQIQRWFLTNSIWVETLLAVVSVGIWIVALPIIIFGTFTAVGGDTSILDVGMIIVAAGFFSVTLLAVYTIVSTVLEIRHQGLFFDQTRDIASVAHDGSQVLKTITSGIFLLCILGYIVVLSLNYFTELMLTTRSEAILPLLLQLLGVSSFLLLATVFIHAFGAFVLTVFDVAIGADDE